MREGTHNENWCPLICIALKTTWNLTDEAKIREKGCGMDGEDFIPSRAVVSRVPLSDAQAPKSLSISLRAICNRRMPLK